MFISSRLVVVAALSSASARCFVNGSCTGTPKIPCDSIPPPEVLGAEVVGFIAQERYNVTGRVLREEIPKIEIITGLDICNVNITLSHREGGDRINFEVWMPLKGWNGRFQGVGGGGWIAGHHGTHGLGIAVEQGFAAAITDGGNVSDVNGFLHDDVLYPDGTIDLGRLSDFTYRGIHEIAVVGKAVATSFYGEPPRFSYWTGCSQGGRQGHMLAQRFPDDFDGILANAPAIMWPSLFLSMGWGEFVMRWKERRPSACVFDSFRRASVAACDGLDGVVDGVISDADACAFDPYSQVGKQITCGNTSETITPQDAEILRLIHEGPRSPQGTQLWKAFPWGISYQGVILVEPPVARLWNDWYRLFVKKYHNYDIASLDTLEELTDLFATSYTEYGGIIGTDVTDLSAFRDQGHKLLSWHGSADDMIMLDNTVHYRRGVESVMGGNAAVNEFYRFFVAPGVSHCFLGAGAMPTGTMDALIAWVEEGKAPDELRGSMKTPDGGTASRKMCMWPLLARYDGEGNPNDAGSFTCA